MKTTIIGAGIAGLASAVRLAAAGQQVTVLEANNYVGGKLSQFSQAGFRFDAGPSLFTMPQFVEELFQLAQKDIQPYFEYERLQTICHYFYEDGTRILAHADKQQFADEVAKKLDISPQIILDRLNHSKVLYDYTSNVFLEQSLHKWKNYFSKQVIDCIFNIHKLHIFNTMNGVNEKTLKHPKLVQLFNRFATYNGSNPYLASGIMNIIPHLEHNIGAFIPKKGMYEITNAIYGLAKDLGVTFETETQAEEIVVENKKTKGVVSVSNAQKRLLPSDFVISNSDVVPTYKKLLKHEQIPYHIEKQERSSSALIFYWGINKNFEELGVHNIFFTENYPAEFDCLFKTKTLYHDPTVYINITAKKCKADAPEGCENWFVMINAPANYGQNWDLFIAEARKNILSKLGRMLGVNIEPLIQTEGILSPPLIEAKTTSFRGSLYGTSSNTMMSGFLRHPNFSQKIKNLYFCGGSV
ncbi:MAG: 1-hydroxycarotenoid 3,4-desaturase CrtD, partial [Bacteroidia bacterium]